MTTTDPRPYCESIRTCMARRAGPHADGRATALAALAVWRGMAAQLEPVIGARGVDALFGRALHLTGRQHPWLATAGVRGSSATALNHVEQQLAAQQAAQATEAAQALLTGFTELLATMVGDALVNRLLAPAWDAPAQATEQEHAS